MTNFGWNYPPGTPGPRATSVTFKCVTEGCPNHENDVTWEAAATTELGGTFLDNDDHAYCDLCDREGEAV